MKRNDFIKNKFYAFPNGIYQFKGIKGDAFIFLKDGVEFKVHENYMESIKVKPALGEKELRKFFNKESRYLRDAPKNKYAIRFNGKFFMAPEPLALFELIQDENKKLSEV